MSFSRGCRSLQRHGPRLDAQLRIRPEFPLISKSPVHSRRSFTESKHSRAPSDDAQPAEETENQGFGIKHGSLGPSSIFNRIKPPTRPNSSHLPVEIQDRNPASMAPILDPKPRAREQFERKMIMRDLRRRGQLTREELIKRTEREYVGKSELHKTGMKKIAPLARQIAGKTLDDAIVQMEFSRKRAATWIKAHLEDARNRAIIERGLNLGSAAGAAPGKVITLKDGSRHEVRDPSAIYIDQAWVNKGSYGMQYKKRARTKIEVQYKPTTSLTVLLKEEKTRIREHEDRVAKEEQRKAWVQLPNRRISSLRPYYSW